MRNYATLSYFNTATLCVAVRQWMWEISRLWSLYFKEQERKHREKIEWERGGGVKRADRRGEMRDFV